MINLFNYYAKIVSESNFKATQGAGRPPDLGGRLKILTPKNTSKIVNSNYTSKSRSYIKKCIKRN